MFEAVRNNKRIAQIILAIIIVPFAFFGMDAYFSDAPGGNEAASVGDSRISMQEFENALREQQDRMRESAEGQQLDRALFESEPFRRAVLDNLINQRVLALYAADNRISVTQPQLQAVIGSVAAFQSNGQFSLDAYETALRGQGMTPQTFEARLAQDLRIQQVVLPVGEAAFTARDSARRFLAAQLEERKVREWRFSPADFLAGVKLEEGAAKRFYEGNVERFRIPARLKAEYLVLDEEAVKARVAVAEDQLRQFYEANAQRFGRPEERQVRHILVTVPEGAPAEEEAAARAKAEKLLASLREDPKRFEALARAESQDPGSAPRGGDLGFFGRGVMVPSFEEAAFALPKGQISEIVRSDFGFHILQVTDVREASVRPFDEVRDEIAEEVGRQEARRRFAELAEQFSNTVYEQADSLQPAAELAGLKVQRSDWIVRDDAAVGPYDSPRLVGMLFGEDAVTHKRNTEAVEVGNGTLVAARVAEYEAAKQRPFDEVSAEIEQMLRTEEAAKLAVARGEAALAALKEKGKDGAAEARWSETRTLQRGAGGLPQPVMRAVFGTPAAQLPAYAGVALPGGGYAVFSIDAVERPQIAEDDQRLQALSGQYTRLMAERDFNAFITALRERYPVEIRSAALSSPQQ